MSTKESYVIYNDKTNNNRWQNTLLIVMAVFFGILFFIILGIAYVAYNIKTIVTTNLTKLNNLEDRGAESLTQVTQTADTVDALISRTNQLEDQLDKLLNNFCQNPDFKYILGSICT